MNFNPATQLPLNCDDPIGLLEVVRREAVRLMIKSDEFGRVTAPALSLSPHDQLMSFRDTAARTLLLRKNSSPFVFDDTEVSAKHGSSVGRSRALAQATWTGTGSGRSMGYERAPM